MKRYISGACAAALFFLALAGPFVVRAATTPPLGAAATYAILSSTFTNTSAGTSIVGDIGFVTGPAVTPLGVHTNYGSAPPYAAAGGSQGNASVALASSPCTFTFSPGAIDLSLDTTHGPIGIYAPGVYCSVGAMSITGPLTLTGSGTYIFRAVGALNTAAGAVVSLAGASTCDVFWTATGATTLGANTIFEGTVIDDAGITVGANTVWTGRALAFSGTVTTDTDTITAPLCPLFVPPPTASLHIIKNVLNSSGGTSTPSSFTVHLTQLGVDVVGSPAAGTTSPGTLYTLLPGNYLVSENASSAYSQSFTGDCDLSGNITLLSGEDKTCMLTNIHIPLPPSGTSTSTNSLFSGSLSGILGSTTATSTSFGTLVGTVLSFVGNISTATGTLSGASGSGAGGGGSGGSGSNFPLSAITTGGGIVLGTSTDSALVQRVAPATEGSVLGTSTGVPNTGEGGDALSTLLLTLVFSLIFGICAYAVSQSLIEP